MSNNDTFSNIKKTLSVTASSFLNSRNVSDTILSSNGPYETLLKNTLANDTFNGKSLSKLKGKKLKFHIGESETFQDIYSARNGEKYFNNDYTDKRNTFRILSYINDDLLHDIGQVSSSSSNHNRLLRNTPDKESPNVGLSNTDNPSLFEGFKVTVNTNATLYKDINTDNTKSDPKLLGGKVGSNSLTSMAPEQNSFPSLIDIKDSTSLAFLTKSFNDLLKNVEDLEIKKQLSASEVNELDSQIEHLKVRRELMFNRIVTLEENQFLAENKLSLLKDRIETIKGSENLVDSAEDTYVKCALSEDINSDVEAVQMKRNKLRPKMGAAFEESGIDKTQSYVEDTSVLDDKNLTKERGFTPLQAFFQPKNMKFRKTQPTLQQYYPTGTKIHTLQKCHESSINCLDFDVPFGVLCSTGYNDYTIKIWDLSRYKEMGRLEGHTDLISCMEMNSKYSMLITGSKDSTLKLWDIDAATQPYVIRDKNDSDPLDLTNASCCVHTFEAHVDEVTCLSINSNTLVTGSQDRTVRIWDLMTGNCVQTLDMNFSTIPLQPSSTPDIGLGSGSSNSESITSFPVTGALQAFDVALATGTVDGLVRLWDLRSGEVIRTLKGHSNAITCLKFDTTNIITGSADKSVKTWDLRTGGMVDSFTFGSFIRSLDFDKSKIIVATEENTVKVFDRKEQKHWCCDDPNDELSLVESLKYKDGYLVEGRNSGDVNVWAL
ncbi:similar to Saccharomyces cerevisiae YJL112W MDV1 Peripheral protein of the cytosolic face of the mitochondrial outer membrane, required for mitochondrial fission [Maudiozyma saulgeensis]|uniref:Similar to Saccharomyces cerevisiae YJL112W MDV1 Peripheral protein of the cytosolic face of the mitochondrial outer membrane, required for mitochondrial fission n=1 Tax=Maudiozyma saulgeensis TaxID=1789683 RepID=A0A1X7QX65_9SACH|nr:similar to Saccharomyces cerevisiae YJL112W MDV1 Peripheral protein of the cytosolic face of the mitochondrial outer membrane, required for mitochondrial fission [Kazachstania saulgeensis]